MRHYTTLPFGMLTAFSYEYYILFSFGVGVWIGAGGLLFMFSAWKIPSFDLRYFSTLWDYFRGWPRNKGRAHLRMDENVMMKTNHTMRRWPTPLSWWIREILWWWTGWCGLDEWAADEKTLVWLYMDRQSRLRVVDMDYGLGKEGKGGFFIWRFLFFFFFLFLLWHLLLLRSCWWSKALETSTKMIWRGLPLHFVTRSNWKISINENDLSLTLMCIRTCMSLLRPWCLWVFTKSDHKCYRDT